MYSQVVFIVQTSLFLSEPLRALFALLRPSQPLHCVNYHRVLETEEPVDLQGAILSGCWLRSGAEWFASQDVYHPLQRVLFSLCESLRRVLPGSGETVSAC